MRGGKNRSISKITGSNLVCKELCGLDHWYVAEVPARGDFPRGRRLRSKKTFQSVFIPCLFARSTCFPNSCKSIMEESLFSKFAHSQLRLNVLLLGSANTFIRQQTVAARSCQHFFLCSDLHPYILARYTSQRIPANE